MKFLRESHLVGLALMLVNTAAWAQSDEERAGARAAAEQGVKAFNEARWSDAIDRMTRAEKLVHAPTHLLYIAQAEERLGHLVKATETYLKIAREKLRSDAPDAFVNAQEEAKRRVEALKGRLSQITVEIRGSTSDVPVTVTMDGNAMSEALIGIAHPVDPGEHRFEAKTNDMQSGPVTVRLHEGGSDTIVLALQSPTATAGNQAPEAAAAPIAVQTKPVASDAVGAGQAQPTSGLKIAGYVGLGVGVVGTGVGTVLLIASMKKRSDANAICSLPNGDCPESRASEVRSLDSSASSSGTIATVSYAVGGVGLAAGIALLAFSHPSESKPGQTAWVKPYVGPSVLGVVGGF